MRPASRNDDQPVRGLPSIDALMRDEHVSKLSMTMGADQMVTIVREEVARLRDRILKLSNGSTNSSAKQIYSELIGSILASAKRRSLRSTRKVINATGVVLHTNLGRAPLSKRAEQAIINASRYCAVEYDLENGGRGPRGRFAEEMLCELTGAESALIVNNCAAAALLVLTTLASGGESIISRGELVEIGGDFRVPDVLMQSGSIIREVGTTNRTKISDYEKAIGPGTRLILRVHPSNYRIVGFTASVNNHDLADLAHRRGIPLYEDAGSGALSDFGNIGSGDEPIISRSISDGVDIVSFSGDKLLGGPQCGIIVGKRELIESLRRQPLYRALRVSKLIYSSLEATLDSYLRGAAEEIPVQKMLSTSYDDLYARCASMVERSGALEHIRFEIINGESVAGGGSLPDGRISSPLIAVERPDMHAEAIEAMLRSFHPPVVARIERGRVLIDLRTVFTEEEDELIAALSHCDSRNPA